MIQSTTRGQDTADFKAMLADRFGSDEALGVTFMLDDTGEILTAAELDTRYANVSYEQRPSVQSFLPNGGSAVCCTDYARYIKEQLPHHVVRVMGFANEDNPTSRVAREQLHPGGHDFAVVDDRFLVDPWLTLIAGEGDQLVFDLENPDDASIVQDIYGQRTCWSEL